MNRNNSTISFVILAAGILVTVAIIAQLLPVISLQSAISRVAAATGLITFNGPIVFTDTVTFQDDATFEADAILSASGITFDDGTTQTTSAEPQAPAATFVVCASDAVSLVGCDYTGTATDGHTAVNAAFAACPAGGCHVKLTEGTFPMTGGGANEGSIELDGVHNVWLQGSGCATNIVIPSTHTSTMSHILAVGRTTATNRPIISDLCITGNASITDVNDGLSVLEFSVEPRVERVRVTGVRRAGIAVYADFASVKDVHSVDNGIDLYASGADYLRIEGGYYRGTTDDSTGEVVYVNISNGVKLSGAHLEQDTANGIILRWLTSNGDIFGNTFYRTGTANQDGVYFNSTTIGGTFSSNQIHTDVSTSTGVGLRFDGTTDWTITGNNFNWDTVVQPAVYVTGASSRLTFTANQFINGEWKVYLDPTSNAQDFIIADNVMSGGAGHVFLDASASSSIAYVTIKNNVMSGGSGAAIGFAENIGVALISNVSVHDNNLTNNALPVTGEATGGNLYASRNAGWLGGGEFPIYDDNEQRILLWSGSLNITDAVAAPITITIPDASSNNGAVFSVMKSDASTSTVYIDSGSDINGTSTPFQLAGQYDMCVLTSSGVEYVITGGK